MPNSPYGYLRRNNRLFRVPAEQRILRAMRRMRDRGLSYRQIADALNRAGYRTRRGTEWRHQYLVAILKES